MVRVRLQNPPQNLLPKMAIAAELQLQVNPSSFVVKRDALVRRDETWLVYTVVNGKAAQVPVKLVVDMGETMAISSNQLQNGQAVVVPKGLSDRNLTLTDVTDTLRTNNRDIRGGPLVLGKREYQVRTVNRAQELKQLETFVLRRDDAGTVYLGDVANVEMGRKFQDSAFLFNDAPSAGVGIIRRVGANVPQVSKGFAAGMVVDNAIAFAPSSCPQVRASWA
jgi:hypothetical protein